MPEPLPNMPRFIIENEDGSWQGADHPDDPWRSIPAPQQALPWPTDGPAVPESREPASVASEATGPRPLSPVEKVQERYRSAADEYPDPDGLAAAIRAVADRVVPEGSACMIRMPETDVDGNEAGGMLLTAEPNARIRRGILAIAAELEGFDG